MWDIYTCDEWMMGYLLRLRGTEGRVLFNVIRGVRLHLPALSAIFVGWMAWLS